MKYILIAVFAIIGICIYQVIKNRKEDSEKQNRKVNLRNNSVNSQNSQGGPNAGDDSIITLKSAKGEDIQFVEIAGIAYNNNFYAILQPVKLLDGMDDDEALVFKVTQKNGEDCFEIELNDSVIDAVFEEYDKLYEQENGK